MRLLLTDTYRYLFTWLRGSGSIRKNYWSETLLVRFLLSFALNCCTHTIFYLSHTGGGPGGGAGQGRAEVQREAGQRPPHGAPAAHALQPAPDHGWSIGRLGYTGGHCPSSNFALICASEILFRFVYISVGDPWHFGVDPDPVSAYLTNGSGSDSFLQWLWGCKKISFFCFL